MAGSMGSWDAGDVFMALASLLCSENSWRYYSATLPQVAMRNGFASDERP
jgi:hypothetical protein